MMAARLRDYFCDGCRLFSTYSVLETRPTCGKCGRVLGTQRYPIEFDARVIPPEPPRGRTYQAWYGKISGSGETESEAILHLWHLVELACGAFECDLAELEGHSEQKLRVALRREQELAMKGSNEAAQNVTRIQTEAMRRQIERLKRPWLGAVEPLEKTEHTLLPRPADDK